MKEIKLKPCPFCGESNIDVYLTIDRPITGWRVACVTAECDVNPFTRTRWKTEAEAIASWNRRQI